MSDSILEKTCRQTPNIVTQSTNIYNRAGCGWDCGHRLTSLVLFAWERHNHNHNHNHTLSHQPHYWRWLFMLIWHHYKAQGLERKLSRQPCWHYNPKSTKITITVISSWVQDLKFRRPTPSSKTTTRIHTRQVWLKKSIVVADYCGQPQPPT
jgi:hypothetical protein